MKDQEHNAELDHLFWKDEILQVMYWMYGEGLGAEVGILQLVSLLNTQEDKLGIHLNLLVESDYLELTSNPPGLYKLTDFGRKEAGKRFSGAFQGLQKAGHGECGPDCDCQWEGHDSCQHHLHSH